MARPLFALHMKEFTYLSIPISIFVVLSVLSLVTFLCASHRNEKSYRQKLDSSPHSNEKRLLTNLRSNISEKAHLMVKMVSWKKLHPGGGEGEYDDESEEAVWRKTIIMGERCRPLEFSGKIVYDSEGKLVVDSTHQENKKKVCGGLREF